MTRQMVMVGFLQAQNCTNLPSSWRHPESRDDSMSADYYQEIARILDLPLGTVKTYIHRGRNELRVYLEDRKA